MFFDSIRQMRRGTSQLIIRESKGSVSRKFVDPGDTLTPLSTLHFQLNAYHGWDASPAGQFSI
jgi:hypothetical protein